MLLTVVVALILLFVDGLIFGVAAAKGILSLILVVVGLILASLIGVTIPFLSTGNITTHLTDIAITQARYFSYYIYSFPVAWIIGFIVGILLA